MRQKLARLLRERIVQNVIALYGITIANALIPLILIPLLARSLQPEAWGLVIFAQTTSIWLGLLVEYGFVFSATREVARHADQPDRLREIVAEVMGGKLMLCAVAVVSAFLLWMLVPGFHAHPVFLIGALWMGLAQGLSPMWYFQGVERMSLPALLSVGCRLLFTGLVFVLVRNPEDAPLVVILQAASMTLSLTVQFVLMYRQTGWGWCSSQRAWLSLKDAWPFFLFVAVVSFYSNANGFMLGLMAAPAMVSFYGGPERLMRGILGLAGPVNQVLYPRLAFLVRHDYPVARSTVRRGTLLVASIGTLFGLSLTLAAPWFVHLLFGTGYEGAIPVLRVLGLACPFSAVSSVLGIRWMFPLGMERAYNCIVLAGAVLNVGMVLMLVGSWQAVGAAYAVLTAEIFITATLFVLLWKRRLNPFQSASAAGLEVEP